MLAFVFLRQKCANYGDEPTSTPSAGAEQGIYVSEGGRIDLSGFTISYAGQERGLRFDSAALRIKSDIATSTLRNGIIEYSYEKGLWASLGAKINLSNIIFRHHTEKRFSGGLSVAVELSDATFEGDNITFEDNNLDIRANNSTVTCTNCQFLPSGMAKTDPVGLLP